MESFKNSLSQLRKKSNEELVKGLRHIGRRHRRQSLEIISFLAEVARRKLFGQLGFKNLNSFAIEELGLGSSSTAHRYCDIAWLAIEFPEVLDMIDQGELTMETAGQVRRVFREQEAKRPTTEERLKKQSRSQEELNLDQCDAGEPASFTKAEKVKIIQSVKNMSRREVDRKLAEQVGTTTTDQRPESYVRASSGVWNYLTVALSDEELELFNRLRSLLSNKTGSGNIADTQLRMMMEMLEKHDPVEIKKRSDARREKVLSTVDVQEDLDIGSAEPKKPPKKVSRLGQNYQMNRKVVMAQSDFRCQFVSQLSGRRCDQTKHLDVDHILPRAQGGGDEIANLQVLCAHHNRTIKGAT